MSRHSVCRPIIRSEKDPDATIGSEKKDFYGNIWRVRVFNIIEKKIGDFVIMKKVVILK